MALIRCPECGKAISDTAPSCPNCGKVLKRVDAPVYSSGTHPPKKKQRYGLLAFSIIFLIGCIAFSGYLLSGADVPDGGNGSGGSSPNKNEVIQITAEELATAYSENEVAADLAYKGKTLEVTGFVEEIGNDILSDVYVTLSNGEEFSFLHPHFTFKNADEIKVVATLRKGDAVTIRGRCTGGMISIPHLTNCYIVK